MLGNITDRGSRTIFDKLSIKVAVEIANGFALGVLFQFLLDQLYQLDDLSFHGDDQWVRQQHHVLLLRQLSDKIDYQQLTPVVALMCHTGRHKTELLRRDLIIRLSNGNGHCPLQRNQNLRVGMVVHAHALMIHLNIQLLNHFALLLISVFSFSRIYITRGTYS